MSRHTDAGPILPGATIGILGGGQFGRMTAMAARALGYHIHALDPDPSCAARFVVERCLTAAFDDDFAAADIARHCAVVTLEIESVSLASLAAASRYAPIRPGAHVLEVIQDRGRQKQWLSSHGFPTGPFRRADTAADVAVAVEAFGASFVKSCTGGYDGRSQIQLPSAAGPAASERAFADLGASPCVVEKAIDLEAELSVMVARRPSGEVAVFPVALNHHEDRILAWSVTPAPVARKVEKDAREIAAEVASSLGVEGLCAVELFLSRSGELLVNELAPRPHNTFHATEVACHTSQFEQAVRAVCDMPLGSATLVRPAAIVNLLGEMWLAGTPLAWDCALALPGVKVHLYGKRVARKGRKMGHLSAVGATPEDAVALAQRAKQCLVGDARPATRGEAS